jgi:acetyltransferase-like isoleucine patch superfamily enzyme
MTSIIAFLFERVRFERLMAIPYGWVYRMLLRRMGAGAFVSPFIQAVGLDCVSLGDHSRISRNTRLLALKAYGSQSFDPQINIGDNVSIGFGCTLSCIKLIEIGHDVTIGDNVYIADSHHEYRDIALGVLQQELLPGQVSIGRGAWVGYGAFLAGNVSLGEHSVVGANSVVTSSVPAYTVVAGVPAKPLKRFSHELGQWVKLDAASLKIFEN